MMPCANVGSKPWYRCGCTDDNHCHLGAAGSMTFLPLFAPRTEPPVQLRGVGPDRGHLLTESCSDVHLHVCRCRTGDADCRCCSGGSRRQNITACTYWRYLCLIEGVAAARAAAVADAAAADVAAARGGRGPQERCSSSMRSWSTRSYPTESLVEQDCVSSGYW